MSHPFLAPCRRYQKHIILLFSLAFVFLWITVGAYTEVRLGRLFLIILLPCLLLTGEIRLPKNSLLLWAVCAFLLTAGISTCLSTATHVRGGVSQWAIYLACSYAAGIVLKEKACRLMTIGLVTGLLLALCTNSIGYALGWLPSPLQPHDMRLILFTHGANRLALIAAVPAILLIYYLIEKKPIHSTLLHISMLALCCGITLATASRSAVIALGGTTLLICLWKFPLPKVLLPALVLLLGFAGLSATAPANSAHSYKRMLKFVEAPFKDSSVKTRFPIWDAAFDSIKKYPLLGSGAGSFDSRFRAYKRDNQALLLEKYGKDGVEKIADHPHNLILLLLAETGAIGTFLFACVIWGIGIAVRRNPTLCLPPALVLCVYFIHAFFNSAFHHKEAGAFIFSGIGLLIALSLPRPLQPGQEHAEPIVSDLPRVL